MAKINFIFILFSIVCSPLFSQEICDNGIDDDGNGLIDLNDEDCICSAFVPSSLIPNPSFEEMHCCPTSNEMLHCAVGWIQASEPTTDYIHLCEGFLGNSSIPAFAPLPLPDGEGAVGFRDGQSFVGSNYKEYVGACLTEPMEVGTKYRLDFFVGFQDNVFGSTQLDMTIFGSVNCNNLPFGGSSITIGCPANTGNYTELGQQNVSGSNEWVNVVVEFVADQPYEVIVIGPSCAANPNWQHDPYYYVDRLAFAESGEFGTPLENITGSICENDLTLSVTNNPANTYQWYQNGIALSGETNPEITIPGTLNAEGTYLVAIYTNDGCSLSQEYEVVLPPYYAPIQINICDNESYNIGEENFNQSGYYEITIPAKDGCDSIVQLSLDVIPQTYANLYDSFCEGDVFELHDLQTTTEGYYEIIIKNTQGCDSIIQLQLTNIEKSNGIVIPSQVEIPLGQLLDIRAQNFDPDLMSFTWFDNLFNKIGDDLSLEQYPIFETSVLYFEALNQHGCAVLDTVTVLVDKSNIRLYIPNAFSPNRDGINDFFTFYGTIALEKVNTFTIYDRWGGIVFKAENISNHPFFNGWDGTFNGKPSEMGVYCYLIAAEFADGSTELFSGDVSLFR